MNDHPSQQHRLADASSLIRTGRSSEAIPILDSIVASDPACLWALEERGRAKSFTGDHAGAVADFTQLIELSPDNPKGFTSRADVHQSVGNLKEAIQDYSKAISLNPEHTFAYIQRGRLKVLSGDLHGAITDFSAAIKYDHMGPLSGLLNRGKTKHLLGDFPGAIEDLTEAIEWERGLCVFAPLFRGRARLDAKDYHGAISDFTMAITAFPKLTNAYRHRADAKRAAGDMEGALADLSAYDQLGGEDLPAYS
ncbi:MAG: tetratricopeptide repeat protein [Planctomycetales bacterium]